MSKKSKNNFSSLLSQYDSSGLTQRNFCDLHSIPFYKFQYHHRKRIQHLVSVPGFIPVEVNDSPLLLSNSTSKKDSFWLQITYPGNIIFTFVEAVSSYFIRDIMQITFGKKLIPFLNEALCLVYSFNPIFSTMAK